MIIAISNLKGGVGKTTVTTNLAVCFARSSFKTCVIDTDTNQNCIAWYGNRSEELPQITVISITDAKTLGKTLRNIHLDYDFILIDGTPNLTGLNTEIISVSDILVIPIRPGTHDFFAMAQFVERIENVNEMKASLNRQKVRPYFLLNEFTDRVNVYKEIQQSYADFNIPFLETQLKHRIAYVEANFDGKGVFEYQDRKAVDEMAGLYNELAGIIETIVNNGKSNEDGERAA